MSTPRSILLTLIGWIAIILTGKALLSPKNTETSGHDALSVYLLGPAKSLLSQELYSRADLYFHKGVSGKKEAAFQSVFQRWEEAINPTQHAHAEGRETMEIMPWLRLATQTDPKNLEPYLVAAYWLNTEGNHFDQALDVLREAQKNNPERHEVYLEKARTLLAMENPADAAIAIDTALDLINQADPAQQEEAKTDHSHLLSIRSLLYEMKDTRDGAIATAEENCALFPDRDGLKDRLAHLQNNPLNPKEAAERLNRLFAPAHQCEREEHQHSEQCEH
jgi:tetratricopeptide (TPR) repeat protein